MIDSDAKSSTARDTAVSYTHLDVYKRQQYGIIPAYVYTLRGMVLPYFKDPYANYELTHYTELQNFYQQGMIDFR